MSKSIEFIGQIKKVVRQDGVDEAQMVVMIPVKFSSDIPTGNANFSVTEIQSSLEFGKSQIPPEKKGNKKAYKED